MKCTACPGAECVAVDAAAETGRLHLWRDISACMGVEASEAGFRCHNGSDRV